MAKREETEIRKAEDLLAQLVEQTAEQRRKQIQMQYDREIEDLRKRLGTEKGLTVNAKKAIAAQIIAQEQIRDKKLADFDLTVKDEAIKREQVYIQNMLASVEKGTKEEYQLKVKAINAAYQLELDAAKKQVMNEEEKNALLKSINEKYYKQEQQAYKDHHKKLQDEQKKAIENRYKEKILEAQIGSNGTDELGVLRLQMEEKQALLEAAQQREGETIEEFNLRKLQLKKEYLDSNRTLCDAEFDMEERKWDAIARAAGAASAMFGEMSEHNKTLAKAAQVLALGEIAIHTGVAIAAGIREAQLAGPFPANLAAIATTVAKIMAGITSAIKTVKSAKFASGGLVTGSGSETSDSIPARLSNGESVMTASATRMFAPALSAFNQIGGGVPIMSSAGGGAQIGEEYLARAVARGFAMAPRPVVSVEEINNTSGRVETIERIGTIK